MLLTHEKIHPNFEDLRKENFQHENLGKNYTDVRKIEKIEKFYFFHLRQTKYKERIRINF